MRSLEMSRKPIRKIVHAGRPARPFDFAYGTQDHLHRPSSCRTRTCRCRQDASAKSDFKSSERSFLGIAASWAPLCITVADPADDPEAVLQEKNRDELLRRALTRLSPEHRQVIDLVYYHEKSVDEVAHILDVPPATVKTRMFYARKKLAELLKEGD
jgi:RNA polymerase sigma factor (sigma-70 family)